MPERGPHLAASSAPPADGEPPSAAQPSPRAAAKPATFPVVAIGASAGGLDACRKLLDALPDGGGAALCGHADNAG
jgi:two-component system, chemotaxis family, CheB/CheR fusion protein